MPVSTEAMWKFQKGLRELGDHYMSLALTDSPDLEEREHWLGRAVAYESAAVALETVLTAPEVPLDYGPVQ